MFKWLVEQAVIFLVCLPFLVWFGSYLGLPWTVSVGTTGIMWLATTAMLSMEKPWQRS